MEYGGEALGVVEAGQFPGYRGEGLLGDLLAAEVPDHGAELGLDAESQAVVDAPDLATRVLDAVASFSIGVVDHQIENCDGLHLLRVGVAKLEIVGCVGVTDEELQGAFAIRAIPYDGGRDEVPAEGFAEEIGGDLPLVEGADGEVPEGVFAALGLVDAVFEGLSVKGEFDQEGVVRAAEYLIAFDCGGTDEVAADIGVEVRTRCWAGPGSRPLILP